MELFDNQFEQILAFLNTNQDQITRFTTRKRKSWPLLPGKNLILNQDTAVELGSPKEISTSLLVWTNRPDRITHRQVTLIGPDIPAIPSKEASFGKIVLIGGEGFDAENCYDRYLKLEQVACNLHLEGYMMRSGSRFQREWIRISREAVGNGFSFQDLGDALIDRFLLLPFVRSAEVVFISSGREEVRQIQPTAEQVMRIIGAISKMKQETSFDCATCEYTDVCAEVEELRAMRQSQRNGRRAHD